MTISEIRKCGKDCLTPADIAGVFNSDPNTIRMSARLDPKSIGFPFSFVGSRMKIPRQGFLNWYDGKLKRSEKK